jgi:hypothetical protein
LRGRQKDAKQKDDTKSNKDDIKKRKVVEAEAREVRSLKRRLNIVWTRRKSGWNGALKFWMMSRIY